MHSNRPTAVDLVADMRRRWVPSLEQDAAVAARLENRSAKRPLFTAQLLVNKRPGLWTTDVEVIPLPGVYANRNEASAACIGAASTYRLLYPAVPVSASYCRHSRLATAADPAITEGGRTWQTHFGIFEDDLAAATAMDQEER